MKRQYITPTHIMHAQDLRTVGYSWWACGQLLGLEGSSLRKASQRPGNARAYTHVPPERFGQARVLRAVGRMPWKMIARKLGVNWMTLYKGCRDGR